MNAMATLLPFVGVLTALATAYILVKVFPVTASIGRTQSIDGLRGFLAVFVVLHHAAVWRLYLVSYTWENPKGIAGFFGPGSVSLFFMITGFLFYSKILDADQKPLDWTRIYVSRILRLTPLYLFAMAILVIFVAFSTHFVLKTSRIQFAKDLFQWCTFTITGTPGINNYPRTAQIICSVMWTLPYEWMFYFTLPALAAFTRRRPPKKVVLFGCIALLIYGHYNKFTLNYPVNGFLMGMSAALFSKYTNIRSIANSASASLTVLACFAGSFALFCFTENNSFVWPLAGAFILIAGGNTLFGLLTVAPSRLLGEISYSVYLLHGFFFFAGYNFFFGTRTSAQFSPLQHWLIVFACMPVFLLGCCLTFKYIEAPAMRFVSSATSLAHSFFRLGRAARPATALRIFSPETSETTKGIKRFRKAA